MRESRLGMAEMSRTTNDQRAFLQMSDELSSIGISRVYLLEEMFAACVDRSTYSRSDLSFRNVVGVCIAPVFLRASDHPGEFAQYRGEIFVKYFEFLDISR